MINPNLILVKAVLLLIIAGWFDEWGFIIQCFRCLNDWRRGGSAFPIISDASSYLGLRWASKIYRGIGARGIGLKDISAGIALIVLFSLLITLPEFASITSTIFFPL